jgi:hypothetical protein
MWAMRRCLATIAALVMTMAGGPSVAASSAAGAGWQRPPADRDESLHRDFLQTSDAHFTMLFEGPEDYALAGRAMTALDSAYFRIGSTLGTYPDDPITVVLYTEQTFRDITRAPAWAAAAYDGKIRVPIRGALAHPEELDRVLSHEVAHAFVHTIAPRGVPTWLSEGIAMFFEPGGGQRADERLTRSTRRLPFARLSRQFGSLSPADAELAYAQSAVITRHLFAEGGGWGVQALLRDLSDGVSFPEAYERHIHLPFREFPGTSEPGR